MGHAFVVFKFRPGGFSSERKGAASSNYLVVSQEAYLKKGEQYNAVAGQFNTYREVFVLSTLESFVAFNVVNLKVSVGCGIRRKIASSAFTKLSFRAVKHARIILFGIISRFFASVLAPTETFRLTPKGSAACGSIRSTPICGIKGKCFTSPFCTPQ
ncbi:MAG: hypothetical protein WC421_10585 [Elusimicrobiales bacterium]